MSKSLFIFAEIKPKPEHFHAVQQAIFGILKQTREEAGCLSFDLLEAPDKDALFLFEEWIDEASLNQHHEQPYTVNAANACKEWLAEPTRVVPMHRLA